MTNAMNNCEVHSAAQTDIYGRPIKQVKVIIGGMDHKEPMAKIVLGAAVTTAFHPFVYTKTLIQLGYEPVAPISVQNIFGKQVLAYPNLFQYLQNIRKVDGFLGMYRGLLPRVVGGIVGSYVNNLCQKSLPKMTACWEAEKEGMDELDQYEELEEDDQAMMVIIKDTGLEVLCRCAGVIISQPFQVIMVRSMAQFIGRETGYDNLFSSISEIYNNNGIMGFFAGLAPRLVGEILTIALANGLAFVLNRYVIPTSSGKDTRQYTNAICSLAVTQVTYPFVLISNVMAVSNSGLAAGKFPYMPQYSGWTACWRQLARDMQLKRGSSLFMRYYKGPTAIGMDGEIRMLQQ